MSACLDCGGTECFCRLSRERHQLARACQLFTLGLGGDTGYYPSLGGPNTAKAIELMRSAGVEPTFLKGLS